MRVWLNLCHLKTCWNPYLSREVRDIIFVNLYIVKIYFDLMIVNESVLKEWKRKTNLQTVLTENLVKHSTALKLQLNTIP